MSSAHDLITFEAMEALKYDSSKCTGTLFEPSQAPHEHASPSDPAVAYPCVRGRLRNSAKFWTDTLEASAVFDFKSCYHHIEVHPEYWKYLGFSWKFQGGIKYFVFTVLPFGLLTTCYVFTKVMRLLIKRWRGMGLRVIVYIDDGICFADGAHKAGEAAKILQGDLVAAGWVVNREKSCWSPRQRGHWLGFDLDLAAGMISVPEQRQQRLLASIEQCTRPAQTITARKLASIVGQVVSMSLAVGNLARLMTRECYALINSCEAWSSVLDLNQGAGRELRFWHSSLARWNGARIWHTPSTARIAYSDASDVAYGGYVVDIGQEVAHGQWSPAESRKSSTWRELMAIYKVLSAFAKKKRSWLTRL